MRHKLLKEPARAREDFRAGSCVKKATKYFISKKMIFATPNPIPKIIFL